MADVNYEYIHHYITNLPGWRTLRVLDYGCGAGDLVRYLRNRGVHCYGVDLRDMIRIYDEFHCDLLHQQIIKPILSDGKIPFLMKFDVVISNQVIEHVDDLKTVFNNIRLVLKPSGHMHHHFPCSETIREGHIGIPFSHWFNPGRVRFLYTYLVRSLGFGYYKKGHPSIKAWTKYKLDWIDHHCRYREFEEVRRVAEAFGYHSESSELDYIKFRVRSRPVLQWIAEIKILHPIYEFLFRRLGFRVIDLRLSSHSVKTI